MGFQLEPGLGQPTPDRLVHRASPDDPAARLAPTGRNEGEGMALPAAEAAMGTHELLERRHLVGLGVVHAVDEDVRAMREAVRAAQVVRSGGLEGSQWI